MVDKKPFDNAAGMRKLLLAGSVLVGGIVASTMGVRALFSPGPPKGPEIVMAVDGAAEIGSFEQNTNTLTINAGTKIDLMAPGHFMLRDAAGKNSKDMFFNGQLNVKISGPAGDIAVTAYPDIANSRGSTVVQFDQVGKGHKVTFDARQVPLGKVAAILNVGDKDSKFTMLAPQPFEANSLKTSRSPRGTFVTNKDDHGFLLIAVSYKGEVALQTPRGQIKASDVPHNVLQQSLKELGEMPAPAAGVGAPPPVHVAPPAPMPPVAVAPPATIPPMIPPAAAGKADPLVPPAALTPEEKLAQSRADIRQQQQKVVDAAQKLRGETMDARLINRNIIASNPRVNEYTRSVQLNNYDAVTRNVQGNFDVWIGKMQLEMKVDDIATARKNLGESLEMLKAVERELRGNKAEVENERKEKARQEAKATQSPLSAAGLGNNDYAVSVRSFGENSNITISPTDIKIEREDGKEKLFRADDVKNEKARFTQLRINEPGVYDIFFTGTAHEGLAFQISSTHKDATVRVHFDDVPDHLVGKKSLPIEIRAAGEVIIQTADPKPEKLELKPVGKSTSVELDSKPLIRVVEPKTPVKIQEGNTIKTSALAPVDGFQSLVAAPERPDSHLGRLVRGDFGIG